MFQRAIKELCGDEVVARFGPIGTIEDLYIDGAYWQVRYLVLATAEGPHARQLLLSSSCVVETATTRDRFLVKLSRAQMEAGAGIWPMDVASAWVQHRQLYSARGLTGLRIEARDGTAGHVADLLVDDEHWSIDYLIAATPPVPGARHVLVPLDWVGPLDLARKAVYLRRTRDELRSSPSL